MRAIVVATTLLALAAPAEAFKIKTHIYTANIIMDDVVDGSVYLPGLETMHRFQVKNGQTTDAALNAICDLVEPALACRMPTGPELAIRNELLREAVFMFPEMVRGGAMGPDGFPDFIWGQQSTHVDHARYPDGPLRFIFGGPRRDVIYGGVPFLVLLPGGTTMVTLLPTFLRDPDDPYTWRAIDYGVYLLGKALAWHADAPRGSAGYYHRLQGVAFSYGYLLHMAGDANMHGILNRQVGSFFDMFTGAGLFGPLTEEVKHITAEGFVDAHMTPALFGPNAFDPGSIDPKLPGTNGVVEHAAIVPPAGLACPVAPPARWTYCNPIDDAGHLTGSCVSSPENPYAAESCDPWTQLCYSAADVAAARASVHEGLAKCAQRTPNTCGDPAPCRLAPYEDALADLPLACDPMDIVVRREGVVVREKTNACILANCAFDARRCPQQGLLGFADRDAVAPVCSMDPERFGTARAAFLSGTTIAAPTDFIYLTMVEDPRHEISDISSITDPSTTIDHVRKRAVGGPYLHGLLELRDLLRGLAENGPAEGGLRGISLDPARFGHTIAAFANTSTPGGRFLRGLGDGLDSFTSAVGTVEHALTCVLSFGLICPGPETPPIFTPSVLLGRRAALIDEQVHRYLEMSVCLAQNVIDGAQTDSPVGDHCEDLPWYHENHRIVAQAQAAVVATFGHPPATGPSFLARCLGVREHPEDHPDPTDVVDHGSFALTLKKIESFLVDDTLREVLSLHSEDLGIQVPELARVIFVELNYLVANYVSAPLTDVFNQTAGELCNQVVAAGFPDVQAVGFAMTSLDRIFGTGNEELAVNVAFLREDAYSDPAYHLQVHDILAAMPDPMLVANFETWLITPPTSEIATATDAQRLVDALLSSPAFGALQGPEVRHLRGYFGMNQTPGSEVRINRAWPLWNTIQLGKLIALSFQGIVGLEKQANAIPDFTLPAGSVDTGAADLLHAARGGNPAGVDLTMDVASYAMVYTGGATPPGKASELYDLWCGSVDNNLLCNAVASLDDPDDYEHYGPGSLVFAKLGPTNEQNGLPGPERYRGVLLDRVIHDPNPVPSLSYHVTNFALAAPFDAPGRPSTANISRVYGNIFGPFYCNNPGPTLQDRVDTDLDGIVDACDNCPTIYNPGQEDDNLDGIGNPCDPVGDPKVPEPMNITPPPSEHVGCLDGPDSDHDHVGDACDKCPGFDDHKDADHDGIPDGCDLCPGVRSDNTADGDGDGVPDVCDLCPTIAEIDAKDSDCDGVGDSCDNCPNVPNPDQADADHNGVGDACEGSSGCGCQSGGRAPRSSGVLLLLVLGAILRRRRR